VLLQDQVANWTAYAVFMPFILFVLIGGWGSTFESGDASAYIVGAVVVAVVENIFQQREDGFAAFRRLMSGAAKADVDASTKSSWGEIAQKLLIAAGCTAWNLYYAIHDRHVSHPTVDWVQILLFFASLGILSAVRFTGTAYDDSGITPEGDTAWSPQLLREIDRLHARGVRLIQEAASPRSQAERDPEQLVEAVRIFKSIDDPWCQARAQEALADAWEDGGKPDKAHKTREELTKTRQKLKEATNEPRGNIKRVAARGRHARSIQET